MPKVSDDRHLLTSFVVPLLDWTGRGVRDRTTVETRRVPSAAAPIAFVVEQAIEGDLRRFEVRFLWGRLFAPFRLTGRFDPDLAWRRDGYADDFALLMAARTDAAGRYGVEILLPEMFAARERAGLPLLTPAGHLVGIDIAQRMREAGLRDFAEIDGIMHRAVGDPVWAESTVHRGLTTLLLPADPDYRAMARVRHDQPLAAESLLRRRAAMRRGGVEFEMRGRLVEVDPAYAPTRDDAACCARDFAGRITGKLMHLLGGPRASIGVLPRLRDGGAVRLSDPCVLAWFAARDAAAACRDGEPSTVHACFAAAEDLARLGIEQMIAEAEGDRLAFGPPDPSAVERGLKKAVAECAMRREYLEPAFRTRTLA